MYGINNAGVGGSSSASGAGGLPPNRNNASTQNGLPFTHVTPTRRAFPSTITTVRNQQGGLERGVIFPPGSGERFRVRNPEAFNGYAVGRQVQMVIDSEGSPHVVLPMVHPATQLRYPGLNPLVPMADAWQAVADWRDPSSSQSSVHRPLQRAVRRPQTRQATRQTTQQTPTPPVRPQTQQRPAPTLGTLAPQVIYDIGAHLEPDDLGSLSRADRHVANSLAPRRVTVNNAMRLARGEATISRNGDIEQVTGPFNGPAQFNQALIYIQQAVPVEHQKPALRELLRQATTRGQFEAVYDHLQAVGRLPVALISAAYPTATELWCIDAGIAAGGEYLCLAIDCRDDRHHEYPTATAAKTEFVKWIRSLVARCRGNGSACWSDRHARTGRTGGSHEGDFGTPPGVWST